MPKVIEPDQRDRFWRHVEEGWSAKAAAEKAGFSARTAQRLLAERALILSPQRSDPALPGDMDLGERRKHSSRRNIKVPDFALSRTELSPEALDCLQDFGRFRARYFGRISSPWQEHSAHVIAEKLETDVKEYGVINVAPGGGKSTTFTHDIPAWLTARNRSIRGFIGSSGQAIATNYTERLRSSLERVEPEEADEESLRLHLATDAVAAMAVEYGRFKPFSIPDQASPPWAQNRFTVLQHGETLVGEKETTWRAWGWDSGFIGYRVNFIIWDDLVDEESFATVEQQIKMRRRWDNVAERRLEPGGLLILQGQRLGAEDLYRYCKDKEIPDFDESILDRIDDLGQEDIPYVKQYFQISYQAHKENICKASENPAVHSMRAPAYDPRLPDDDPAQGCLLDPFRISWRELLIVQASGTTNYRTVYQQEDSDPSGVLVPDLWLDGGEDDEGYYPGCIDPTRNICTPPPLGKGAKWYSYVTVDSSPTKFWSIQWWVYVQLPSDPPHMGNRYLMDMLRVRLTAPEFLDFNVDRNDYEGIMVQWHDRAKDLRFPIHYLIFEANAAERFIMQYPWFRNYLKRRNIQLKKHATFKNKADPEYGVTTIRNHYKFGRKILPGGSPEALRMWQQLRYELTHYPLTDTNLGTATTDCVLADWFGEYNLPKFVPKDRQRPDIYAKIRRSWRD